MDSEELEVELELASHPLHILSRDIEGGVLSAHGFPDVHDHPPVFDFAAFMSRLLISHQRPPLWKLTCCRVVSSAKLTAVFMGQVGEQLRVKTESEKDVGHISEVPSCSG